MVAGPSHFWPVGGVAVPSVDAFDTPLGDVVVDDDARRCALGVDGVVVDDVAHSREHSLEVQLPLMICVLGGVAVLPLAVGRSGAGVLAQVLERLWGGPETRVVISTDLSHYHPANVAAALDRRTAARSAGSSPPPTTTPAGRPPLLVCCSLLAATSSPCGCSISATLPTLPVMPIESSATAPSLWSNRITDRGGPRRRPLLRRAQRVPSAGVARDDHASAVPQSPDGEGHHRSGRHPAHRGRSHRRRR